MQFLPTRVLSSRTARGSTRVPSPTWQSDPTQAPEPIRHPEPMIEPDPTTARGPTQAPASTTASSATTAAGWIPRSSGTGGAKRDSRRGRASLGRSETRPSRPGSNAPLGASTGTPAGSRSRSSQTTQRTSARASSGEETARTTRVPSPNTSRSSLLPRASRVISMVLPLSIRPGYRERTPLRPNFFPFSPRSSPIPLYWISTDRCSLKR